MRPSPLVALSLSFLVAAGAVAATPPPGFERALNVQKRRAAKRPAHPQVLNDLGNLLALAGRLEEAEEVYRRALEVDPAEASARFNLALVLYESGQARRAQKELRRLLGDHPDHAWGHYQAGVLLDRRGKDRDAVRHYTRAIVLDPRLLEPEVNPHILSNRLRTQAMVRAYRQAPPGLLAPRIYENPARIRKMLVPRPEGGRKRKDARTAEPTEATEAIPTQEVRPPDG